MSRPIKYTTRERLNLEDFLALALSSCSVVLGNNMPSFILDEATRLKQIWGNRIQICDGAADDVEINAAINALTAGRTWKEKVVGIGSFTLTNHVVLDSYTIFDFAQAKLSAKVGGTVEHDLVYGFNEDYVDVLIGLIDNAWTDGASIGVLWDDMQFSTLDILVDRTYLMAKFQSTNRGTKFNQIRRIATKANNLNGIIMSGLSGKEVTLNTFDYFHYVSVSTAAGNAIDFAKFTDNNYFYYAFVYLNYAGCVGVIYNSDTPASDMEVYENNFNELIISQHVASTVSIDGNKTHAGFPTRIKILRLADAQPVNPDLQADSQITIDEYNSNVTVYRPYGYIIPGEIRTWAGSIATLTQNAYNSLDNPFGQAVQVLSLDVYVSTQATATSPNIDCGIGSSATTDYTTLFDDLPGETIGFYNSKVATPGTQTVPQLWASGSGNRYLNMSIKDFAATGMVAKYVVTVMGI